MSAAATRPQRGWPHATRPQRGWPHAPLASLLAAGATIAIGCGSTPLSVSEVRAQASRICLNEAAQAARVPTPRAPGDGAAFLRGGVVVLRSELAQLRALHPPTEVADTYATAVGAFARKLAVLAAAARSFPRQDDPAIALRSLQHRLAPIEAQEDRAWGALQIPDCLNR